MTFGQALIVLAIAGLILGGLVLLLRKQKLPLPPIRIRRAKPEMSPQEKTALMELAQGVANRYPELGSTPAELLAEIDAYCKRTHPSPDNTSRIILEKMLMSGSLQKSMSYWQVHAFLDSRDEPNRAKKV